MNIFQKLFSSLTKSTRQPFTSTLASRYSLQFGGMYAGFLKKKDYMEEYKNWVYACVNQRAKAVANIELILRDGKGEIVEEHEVLDLINSVSKGMTKYQLFFNTQAFKDLDGNAYWWLARERDGKGAIKEIHLLQPNKVLLVQSKENPLEVAGYVYLQQDGTKTPFEANEILHIKNFNPNGYSPFPHKGMSVVEGAQWAVDTDNEIRTWNYNFFKNGARPDGVLTMGGDGAIDEDSYKRIKEQWDAEHQGSENAYKTTILTGGLNWTKVGNNQTELEFAGQKGLNRDEIASLFEVPKFMLGVTDNINRATAEAAVFVFSLFTVKPLMQQIVDTLNEFLLPEYGEDLRFEFKSPVSDDREARLAEYTSGIDKWLTRNEIREKEGLPPTTDGDHFLTPINLTPMDSVKQDISKTVKPLSRKPALKMKRLSKVEKTVADFVSKMPVAKKKGFTPDQKAAYIAEWKANIEANTAILKKKLEKYFSKQEDEVVKNLRSELRGLEVGEYKMKGVSDMMFNEDDAIKAGISLITPHIRDYLIKSGQTSAKLVGVDFDAYTARVENFITSRADYFAKSINETTIDELMSSIKEGMNAGESIDDISNRIADIYNKAKDYRTEVIARTEVSAASNFGSIEGWTQGGVKEIEWTVVDPCDECQANDGITEKIGDAFPTGDTQPPAHPNCVCGTLPVFDNE